MITVRSFMKVGERLVPVAEFEGPLRDTFYIDGSIEIAVDGVDVIPRSYDDLVDQLWAYLARGLTEIADEKDFMTYYPDMPMEVHLLPNGDSVTMRVGAKRVGWREATASRRELTKAMREAGLEFFQRLTPHDPSAAWPNALVAADLRRAAHMLDRSARAQTAHAPRAPSAASIESELAHRIVAGLGDGGRERRERDAIGWRGYLAALYEWGVLADPSYVQLLRGIPDVADDPTSGILLGRLYDGGRVATAEACEPGTGPTDVRERDIVELEARIAAELRHHDGEMPERTVGAWRAYLAGLLEWGVLDVGAYDRVLAGLPDLADDPAVDILLGREDS